MNPETGEVFWTDDHWCIACGTENPIGLKLEFLVEDGRITSTCVFEKRFQGYKDMIHGGMISLVLDETMLMLPIKTFKVPVVSVELTVRFKQGLHVGEKLLLTAEMEDKGRMILTKGQARLEDGTLIATATAKCLRVKGGFNNV